MMPASLNAPFVVPARVLEIVPRLGAVEIREGFSDSMTAPEEIHS
jgi:hypothetical protein